ncbi:hypothetical protein LOK74_14480 [Brevibacillus humidisoli]|uniref:hypothetical protein n=1 Tax=Brevibacillus humidisoli TaxID=2895522 RepID=UPI001E6500A2|nr:hypothetical protein [Brevibacillus humidisoli]UFJ39277.1 hypothetical protein LOK74_14480 [Brevibacillus humidisoli]
MTNKAEKNHSMLQDELLHLLARYRKKPYMPVWGELFYMLRQFKQLSIKQKMDLEVYPLQPTGQLIYEYQTGKFVAQVPELNLYITLELEECVDSLISGRFRPAPRNSHPAGVLQANREHV